MSMLSDLGHDVPPEVPGYSALRLISRGSTARVYRAVQDGPGRTVALKVLRLDDVLTTVTHVERELATMVELSAQPHIVSVIDTGSTTGGEPYLAMEYCEDGSYAGILHRHGPVAVDEVVDLGIKVGEALAAAHAAGIVHRDVKPQNVLRSRFGPALTDFGISRGVREEMSSLTLIKMSPYHASPEALRREPQCPRSDIYGLGSTMWTLLAGWPPLAPPGQPRPDVFEYRNAVLGRPAPPVPRGDVPHWLQDVLARALATDPAHRYAGGTELAAALQRGWSQWLGEPWVPPTIYLPLGPATVSGTATPAGPDVDPVPAAGDASSAPGTAASASGDASSAPGDAASVAGDRAEPCAVPDSVPATPFLAPARPAPASLASTPAVPTQPAPAAVAGHGADTAPAVDGGSPLHGGFAGDVTTPATAPSGTSAIGGAPPATGTGPSDGGVLAAGAAPGGRAVAVPEAGSAQQYGSGTETSAVTAASAATCGSTGTSAAGNATDSAGPTNAPDSTESTDPADATDSTAAVNAPYATGAPGAEGTTDATRTTDARDATGSADAPDAVDGRDAAHVAHAGSGYDVPADPADDMLGAGGTAGSGDMPSAGFLRWADSAPPTGSRPWHDSALPTMSRPWMEAAPPVAPWADAAPPADATSTTGTGTPGSAPLPANVTGNDAVDAAPPAETGAVNAPPPTGNGAVNAPPPAGNGAADSASLPGNGAADSAWLPGNGAADSASLPGNGAAGPMPLSRNGAVDAAEPTGRGTTASRAGAGATTRGEPGQPGTATPAEYATAETHRGAGGRGAAYDPADSLVPQGKSASSGGTGTAAERDGDRAAGSTGAARSKWARPVEPIVVFTGPAGPAAPPGGQQARRRARRPESVAAPAPAPVRFAPRATRRRTWAALAAAAVVGVALGTGVVAVTRLSAADPPAPGRTAAPTAGPRAATDVRLTDRGAYVVLSWTDHSGGSADYVILGRANGGTKTRMARPGRQTSQRIDGLAPGTNYCFTVVGLVAGADPLSSAPACTTR
ncbi:protein kinase domain-containing protein [Actinocatenispora rupis]|nr:protein kinase [Actinocatenispora rupis]